MAIGIAEATLIGIFMESVLYGAYTMLFFTSLYVLLFKRQRARSVNITSLVTSLFMYLLATAHIALSLRRVIDAFIVLYTEPDSATMYLIDSSNKLFVAKSGIYGHQTILGDAFLIYRLFVVWNGDKRVMYPAYVLWLANAVTGWNLLAREAAVQPGTLVYSPELNHWVISFFSITLFTNTCCTALIALKIYLSERRTASIIAFRTQSLQHVLAIVVESGAIYTASMVTLLAGYLSNNWGQIAVFDIIVQIVGIAFSLIIVRIGLGVSSETTIHRNASEMSHSTLFTGSGPSRRTAVSQSRAQYALHDISIQRSRETSSIQTGSKEVPESKVTDMSEDLEYQTQDSVTKSRGI